MLACGILGLSACDAGAQSYPTKVVRYVIPASAGSGADLLGRTIAGGLTQVFNQQVIVDNRAGAGANIGAELAARSPADGYTLFHVIITHALNASLYRNLSYDLTRDFAPVAQLATTPAMVVVHPSLPARSMAELVKLAKARPGMINYASAGTGSFTFLAAELFKKQAGVDLVHVPYRAGSEAQTAVISGETSIYFASIGTVLSYVRQGRLRGLAVTSAKRVPMVPEFPTVAESGYPAYQAGNWHGLMVPAKTPRTIIATLHIGLVSALNNPTVGKRLSDLGYLAVGDQPEEFSRFLHEEIAALARVVKDLGLKAD